MRTVLRFRTIIKIGEWHTHISHFFLCKLFIPHAQSLIESRATRKLIQVFPPSENHIQFEPSIDSSGVLKCCIVSISDDKMVSSVIKCSFSHLSSQTMLRDGALSYLVSKQFIHCSIARGYQMIIASPIAVVKRFTAEGNVNRFLFSVCSLMVRMIIVSALSVTRKK